MKTENLSTLKIHKLTQAQYDRELAAGRIDESAIYLTPDEDGASVVVQPDEPIGAKDGTLWLDTDENYEEPKTTDTTLSQYGVAADAKAVGDALANKQPVGDYALKSEIPTVPTRTLLMSNTNITSAYAARNISISNMSDYDEFFIECAMSLGEYGVLRKTATFTNVANSTYFMSDAIVFATQVYQGTRLFTLTSSAIEVSDAYSVGSDNTITVANTAFIPTKIYGIKYN